MGRMLFTAVAVLSLTGYGETRPGADKSSARVGEIKIIGNTVTPDHYIREHLEIYPGQRCSAAELIVSEWRLALAGLDAQVLAREPEGDGPWRNVEVHIRETPLTYLVFGGRSTR